MFCRSSAVGRLLSHNLRFTKSGNLDPKGMDQLTVEVEGQEQENCSSDSGVAHHKLRNPSGEPWETPWGSLGRS